MHAALLGCFLHLLYLPRVPRLWKKPLPYLDFKLFDLSQLAKLRHREPLQQVEGGVDGSDEQGRFFPFGVPSVVLGGLLSDRFGYGIFSIHLDHQVGTFGCLRAGRDSVQYIFCTLLWLWESIKCISTTPHLCHSGRTTPQSLMGRFLALE